MSNIYEVFNTKSENEFSKFLNKLTITPNELLSLFSIAESFDTSIKEKRQQILELMAGSKNNYKLCIEQFKPKFQRVLKETITETPQSLSLNEIMELNHLIEMVANKLSVENCIKGVYNIVKTKSSVNIAKAFLGMVQQSTVKETNLKFDTELEVDGKNVGEVIYQMKNDIEMFVQSLENSEKETDEQSITESFDLSAEIISELSASIENSNDVKSLEAIIKRINEMIKVFKDIDIQNVLAQIRSKALTKINELNNDYSKLNENNVNESLNIRKDYLTEEVMKDENTRYAGIYDTNNKRILWLKKGEIHANFMSELDLQNGFVRFGLYEYKGKIVGAVNTNSKENANKCIKMMKKLETPFLVEYYMVEIVNPDETRYQYNVDDNGTLIYENANVWEFSMDNVASRMLKENDLSIYNRIAGIYNSKTDSFVELKPGEHHNLTKNDYNKGLVRYGIQETKNYGMLCYITANDSKIAEKSMKKIKNRYPNVIIDTFNLEFVNKDGKKSFTKLRSDGTLLCNYPCTAKNVSKWLKEGSAYIDDNGLLNVTHKGFVIENNLTDMYGELVENCSVGATCAANISTIPTPIKSKKKRKKETIDYSLFKESVKNDIPASLEINGKNVSYKIIEGKNYLYIDNGILKTTDKSTILEAIDDIYNNCLEMEVLEGYNHVELDMILEDISTITTPITSSNDSDDEEKDEEHEKELEQEFNKTNSLKVSVEQDDNTTEIDQELIGIDDSDPNNKVFIVKDPTTGKTKVVSSNNVNIQG